MQHRLNKPVFVVGSPRSGRSILTWCLGHHPNLFPVPESNWLGDFTVNVGIAYQIGAARGDYSVLSAMDIQEDELFAGFGQTINDLIMRHRDHLEKSARPGVSNEALTGVDSKAVAEPFARKNPGSMERRNIRYTLRAAESLSAGSVRTFVSRGRRGSPLDA